jgi:hypothetical protein
MRAATCASAFPGPHGEERRSAFAAVQLEQHFVRCDVSRTMRAALALRGASQPSLQFNEFGLVALPLNHNGAAFSQNGRAHMNVKGK